MTALAAEFFAGEEETRRNNMCISNFSDEDQRGFVP